MPADAMFGDSDLPVFFGDMGVPVMFKGKSTYPNGQPIKGNFDKPVTIKLADMGYGGVVNQAPCVRLAHNSFAPMPKTGEPLFVNGRKYEISEVGSEGDGAVIVYELKAVSK